MESVFGKKKKQVFLDFEDLLFFLILLIFLYPVWAFPYFPSQDGPAHVYNSKLILSFNDPAFPIFSEYLYANSNPDPTWFGHLILAGLLYLFPTLIAEKIFLSVYLVMLPLGARYAIAAVNPNSKFLAILFFPLLYNYLLHMGFYAFSLSLAIGLFVLGYWLKNSSNLTLRKILVLWLSTLLLYLSHVVSLGLVFIIISSLLLVDIVVLIGSNRLKDIESYQFQKRDTRTKIIGTFVAFIPSLAVAGYFLLSRDTISSPGADVFERVYNFLHMMPVVSFRFKEVWLASLYLLFLFGLFSFHFFSKFEKGELNRNDSLLVSLLVIFVVYLFTPQPELVSLNGMSGGGFMDMRVSYYLYFLLLIWIAAQTHSRRFKYFIQSVAIVLCLALIVSLVSVYKNLNRYLKEYTSIADHIEPNTTLLPLDSCGGAWNLSYKNRIKPFLHVSNFIGAERNVLVLRNYEANMGYFPFIYHETRNPYIHIGTLECEEKPPEADFIDYHQRTGGRIDYVSVWLGKKVQQNDPNLLSIYQQLGEGFELIYESPGGAVELYRRKSWAKQEAYQ